LTKVSFPLTMFSNTTKHRKIRKTFFRKRFISKQTEPYVFIAMEFCLLLEWFVEFSIPSPSLTLFVL
jgi:hypothetical protein